MDMNSQDMRAEVMREIEQREAVLASASADRKARLRAGVAMPASEPNRNWHIYALGADLFEAGLRGQDADALMGLRSMPVTRLARLLLDADARMPGVYIGRLLPGIIDAHRDELVARGVQVSWNRRWVRYQADLASWQAAPDDVRHGPWRERDMTAGQRALVQITATLLDIAIPQGLQRGTAADWLSDNGANLAYRQER